MLDLQENFPLSSVTTLKIGGPARWFVAVKNAQELIEAIKLAQSHNTPFLVIGKGSNLLVCDEGINGLVIKNENEGILKERRFLQVQSGIILQHLVDYSIKMGLAGIEKLTGIPGTLGGAVFGNAGAYGASISDNLREVTCFTGKETIVLQKDECEFAYRNSIFKRNGWTILEVKIKLDAGDAEELFEESEDILKKRLVKYPKGVLCPGSFFKNLIASELPEEIFAKIPKDKIVYGKIPAGALLERVGACGDKLGDIEIAPYHANLFINKGQGKASDFYVLAKKYIQKVKEKFGITLEPEVQLINLPPFN